MTATTKPAIVWVCVSFYAIVLKTQEKMFKTSVNARPHCPLTSPF